VDDILNYLKNSEESSMYPDNPGSSRNITNYTVNCLNSILGPALAGTEVVLMFSHKGATFQNTHNHMVKEWMNIIGEILDLLLDPSVTAEEKTLLKNKFFYNEEFLKKATPPVGSRTVLNLSAHEKSNLSRFFLDKINKETLEKFSGGFPLAAGEPGGINFVFSYDSPEHYVPIRLKTIVDGKTLEYSIRYNRDNQFICVDSVLDISVIRKILKEEYTGKFINTSPQHIDDDPDLSTKGCDLVGCYSIKINNLEKVLRLLFNEETYLESLGYEIEKKTKKIAPRYLSNSYLSHWINAETLYVHPSYVQRENLITLSALLYPEDKQKIEFFKAPCYKKVTYKIEEHAIPTLIFSYGSSYLLSNLEQKLPSLDIIYQKVRNFFMCEKSLLKKISPIVGTSNYFNKFSSQVVSTLVFGNEPCSVPPPIARAILANIKTRYKSYKDFDTWISKFSTKYIESLEKQAAETNTSKFYLYYKFMESFGFGETDMEESPLMSLYLGSLMSFGFNRSRVNVKETTDDMNGYLLSIVDSQYTFCKEKNIFRADAQDITRVYNQDAFFGTVGSMFQRLQFPTLKSPKTKTEGPENKNISNYVDYAMATFSYEFGTLRENI